MPYDNEMNRNIAKKLNNADRNYAKAYAFSNLNSVSGGAHLQFGNASKHDSEDGMYNEGIPLGDSYFYGQGISGGSGFAEGSFRDTGYDRVDGAGDMSGSGTKELRDDINKFDLNRLKDYIGFGRSGGMAHYMKGSGHYEYDSDIAPTQAGVLGSGTKELKDDIGKFDFNRLKDYIGFAKPKELMDFKKCCGLRGKGFEDFKADLRKFDANRIKDYVGLGKYGKKHMKGSGFFDSIANFFKQFPEKINSVIMPIAQKITETVQKGKEAVGLGSGTKELKDDINKFDFNRLKDYIGFAKPKELMDFKKCCGLRGKGFEELKSDLRKFDANRIKDYVGLGKYGKKHMKGSGFFDSIANFFKQFPEKINSVIMPIAQKITETVQKGKEAVGLGKSGGMKFGGAILGFPEKIKGGMKNKIFDSEGTLLANSNCLLSNGVPPKAQLHSSSMSGQGKINKAEKDALKSILKKHSTAKPNKRQLLVKKIMAEKGMKMIDASSYIKANNLYQKD